MIRIVLTPSVMGVALNLLGVMLFALCAAVEVQQPQKIHRIGVLGATSPATIAARPGKAYASLAT